MCISQFLVYSDAKIYLFIFLVYIPCYTLGFVQTKIVHSIFLFVFSLFFGSKHFCLLGLNSDSRGWSLIMVGLISDNSVFTHIYTQMRYIRTINCLTLVKTTKISLSSGLSVGRGWGEGVKLTYSIQTKKL